MSWRRGDEPVTLAVGITAAPLDDGHVLLRISERAGVREEQTIVCDADEVPATLEWAVLHSWEAA
jgi:hypothetical protein